MPCSDSRSFERDCSECERRLDAATRAACDMARVLREHLNTMDALQALNGETISWIQDHDEEDRRRAVKSAADNERAQKRLAALSKLSPEDRKLLGV